MKKYFIGAMVGVAALSLAACNESATPIDGAKDTSKLTLEEVFTKTMERQESLQSVKATIDMDQSSVMEMDGEEFNMTSTSNIVMDLTTSPMTLFLDGTVSMKVNEEDESFDMPLQMYFTEADGLFMNDVMSEGWVKMPNDMYETLLAQAGANADSTEQLKQLQPFLEDFSFEQTDTSFILTLNATGEKFKELILEQMSGTLGEELDGEVSSIIEDMEYDNAKYILTIDKNTFDLTKVVLDFAVKTTMDGMSANISTSSTIHYSDFNKVDVITIPQHVIDTAVDASF